MAIPRLHQETSVFNRERTISASLTLLADSITSAVLGEETYTDPVTGKSVTSVLGSSIRQALGLIGMVVSNTDSTSSLTLTPEAISAVTDSLSITGSDGSSTVISGGRVSANDLASMGATIGGFQIDEGSIHTKGVAVTSNADNSIALSKEDFTRTVNKQSVAGLRFAMGDKFGVTGDGKLYAQDAVLSGLTVGAFTDSDQSSILNSNVSVGGRNLFLNSDAPSRYRLNTPTAYNCYIIDLSENMVKGETYTVTLWGTQPTRSDKTSTWYAVYWGGGSVALGNVTIGSDGKGSLTFTAPNNSHTTTNNAWISIYNTPSAGASGTTYTASVTMAKLEKGNKPTDWSPAPEDMATQAGVESVSSNVDGKLAEMAEQSASDRKATDERLTGLETSLGDLESRFATEQEKRRYWMDFDESTGMVIAEHGSDFRIVTTSDRQSFMYGETPMAYTSAYGFNAPNLTVTTELRIGNFLFTPHDGNLAIKFVG